MARFTSKQWAIVEFTNGGGHEVVKTATDSQTLFREYGICTYDGKLSTKQAVYKLNNLTMKNNTPRYLVSLKDNVVHMFVHLRDIGKGQADYVICLLYTSPSPRDGLLSRMPSSA